MIIKLIAILLTSIQVVFSMASFSYRSNYGSRTDFISGEPLNADCIYVDGAVHNGGSFDCKKGSEIKFVFSSPVEVNTALICESGTAVTEFEIYADGIMIYRQDKIEALRYCAFERISASEMSIKITAASAEVKLESIDFYLITDAAAEDFTVTSYVIADRVYSPASIDRNHFSVITDAIVFGCVSFDENGEVYFEDKTIDGEIIGGEQVFARAIENIRNCGNENLRIHLNLLGPSAKTAGLSWEDEMSEKALLHSGAMTDNRKKFIDNIIAVVDKYELDGVFFDYEYPLKKRDWYMFCDFLVMLSASLGSRQLGIAISAWGVHLTPAAIAAVDRFEVMAYDSFDNDGYHSPFYSCSIQALEYFEALGIGKEKLELGIPFYARPVDRAAVWSNYNEDFEQLGKYGNIAYGDYHGSSSPRYLNGWQMVYDKTAFAADYGAKGVMIWHYSCDTPSDNSLSLFNAMDCAIKR